MSTESTGPARRAAPGRRSGFTIVEMLIAATVTLIVLGIAIPFLRAQSNSIASDASRSDALQNARFAQNAVDRDLRMVGAGVLDRQPMVVQADKYVVTFNADLVTQDTSDAWSIYINPDADDGAVTALQPPSMALPLTGFAYPSTAYLDGTSPGRAETISYWVSSDSSSPRPNEYVLFRRVNRLAPTVVTTGLYLTPGQPFFTYTWVRDTLGVIDTVPQSRLPLEHLVPLHGTPADTGEYPNIAAGVDRIRTVRISALGEYRAAGPRGIVGRRTVQGTTTLTNMTALNRVSCGLPPAVLTTFTVSLVNVSGQPDHVHLVWARSADDGAGEKDVKQYLLYRRLNTDPWDAPFADVPAGGAVGGNYSFDDVDVKMASVAGSSSNVFTYAVVAQDCQPQLSDQRIAPALTIPVVN